MYIYLILTSCLTYCLHLSNFPMILRLSAAPIRLKCGFVFKVAISVYFLSFSAFWKGFQQGENIQVPHDVFSLAIMTDRNVRAKLNVPISDKLSQKPPQPTSELNLKHSGIKDIYFCLQRRKREEESTLDLCSTRTKAALRIAKQDKNAAGPPAQLVPTISTCSHEQIQSASAKVSSREMV